LSGSRQAFVNPRLCHVHIGRRLGGFYLIDLKAAVIVDVEASRAVRQAEVGAARTMLERTAEHFGLKPERLAADSAYGSAEMLHWLLDEQKIAPHVPVIDKSERQDGTFSRVDFSLTRRRTPTPVLRARP
jgi:hypothetical protein